jgi:hypothetical protein
LANASVCCYYARAGAVVLGVAGGPGDPAAPYTVRSAADYCSDAVGQKHACITLSLTIVTVSLQARWAVANKLDGVQFDFDSITSGFVYVPCYRCYFIYQLVFNTIPTATSTHSRRQRLPRSSSSITLLLAQRRQGACSGPTSCWCAEPGDPFKLRLREKHVQAHGPRAFYFGNASVNASGISGNSVNGNPFTGATGGMAIA